jgi:hypothetical protein
MVPDKITGGVDIKKYINSGGGYKFRLSSVSPKLATRLKLPSPRYFQDIRLPSVIAVPPVV